MSFETCDEEIGPGLFFSLSDDGDEAVITIVGEPEPRKGTFRGQPRIQAVFPVVTENGIQVWPVGARLYRMLKGIYESIVDKAITVTRHGKPNSQDTTYEVVPRAFSSALRKAMKKVGPADIKSAMSLMHEAGDSGGDNIPI